MVGKQRAGRERGPPLIDGDKDFREKKGRPIRIEGRCTREWSRHSLRWTTSEPPIRARQPLSEIKQGALIQTFVACIRVSNHPYLGTIASLLRRKAERFPMLAPCVQFTIAGLFSLMRMIFFGNGNQVPILRKCEKN